MFIWSDKVFIWMRYLKHKQHGVLPQKFLRKVLGKTITNFYEWCLPKILHLREFILSLPHFTVFAEKISVNQTEASWTMILWLATPPDYLIPEKAMSYHSRYFWSPQLAKKALELRRQQHASSSDSRRTSVTNIRRLFQTYTIRSRTFSRSA